MQFDIWQTVQCQCQDQMQCQCQCHSFPPQSRSDRSEPRQQRCQVEQAPCHPRLLYSTTRDKDYQFECLLEHARCASNPPVFRDPTIKSHLTVLLLGFYLPWLEALRLVGGFLRLRFIGGSFLIASPAHMRLAILSIDTIVFFSKIVLANNNER